ncbi:MAG: DUF177 domain-containing protein [Candidatus Latescibacterota bacterium]|nr:MAG: DUF177 domain-containing protein [Candidatus Latescibacterota bacterium]
MILDLEKLSSDTQLVAADEAVRFDDVDGAENRINCHIELTVRKIAESFFIHADLSGVFTTRCHKCLEPTEHRVETSFEIVVKKASADTGAREVSGDDDLIYLPAGEDQISLDQHIYENLIVNIPMQIFCSDDCKGLCPGCGANLNHEECKCAPESDPRWDALRKLKDTSSE